jgi:hypothetical protein
VTNEEDGKKIVNMKDEFYPYNQREPVEILENVEQVTLLVYILLTPKLWLMSSFYSQVLNFFKK